MKTDNEQLHIVLWNLNKICTLANNSISHANFLFVCLFFNIIFLYILRMGYKFQASFKIFKSLRKFINFLDFSSNTRCQSIWKYIKVLREYKLEIYHSIRTKSNKWNQKVINFLVRQKLINFLKYAHSIMHSIYIYVFKRLSTTLNKGLRKNNNDNNNKKEIEKLENIN